MTVPARRTISALGASKTPFYNGPVYVRLGGRGAQSTLTGTRISDLSGQGAQEGTEATLCCCGIMVAEASAAEVLAKQGISARLLTRCGVAPLPAQLILDSVHRTGCCVAAEEHFARGGLGEGVAALVSAAYPVPVKQVAVFDKFGQSGTPAELQEYYGLTASQIVSAAVQAWTMRRR